VVHDTGFWLLLAAFTAQGAAVVGVHLITYLTCSAAAGLHAHDIDLSAANGGEKGSLGDLKATSLTTRIK
jgi:hypothetical protein